MNPYETPKLLGEYLLLHYGEARDVLGDLPGPREAVGFPVRSVRELLVPVEGASALDLGCAVGASSFELARTCGSVMGIDFSQSFVEAAERLRIEGAHPFEKIVEGEFAESCVVGRPADIDGSRISFERGDAGNLRAGLGSFDVVFAANLLCRLPDPRRLIARLPDLVTPGGQLLLTTPLTWLEEFTPKENWIGGTAATGRSFDVLRELLAPEFSLEHRVDLPFLIREHARKFQYGVALGSRWRRH